MTLDDGSLKIYKTVNTAASGAFPALQLVKPWDDNEYDFGFLTIGNARYLMYLVFIIIYLIHY